jgi:ribosomal protein S10
MLDSFVLKLTENLTNWLEKDQIQIRYLKQEHTKLTVLRSPFVYKKTREQFAKTQYGVLL